jgi:3-dehydroquinate dehydratase-2
VKVLVLHGPNLNLLGQRPGDDPSWSFAEAEALLGARAKALSVELRSLQSNHEGALIDALHAARGWAGGAVVSPGALSVNSYALRDAIAAVALPTFEVHLTEPSRREAWRRTSVLKEVCAGQILGKGLDSYALALEALVALREPSKARSPATATAKPKASPGGPRAAKRVVEERVSRAEVRKRISERLAGRLTPSGLSTWARERWVAVRRGAPAESGQRALLEDTLQTLAQATTAKSRLTDDQLIALLAQLG